MNASNFMFPNVSRIPSQTDIDALKNGKVGNAPTDGKPGEFQDALTKVVNRDETVKPSDTGPIQQPLKFSSHATQRLQDRKINFAPEMMARVNSAIDRAAAKGIEESLILTPDAALIVSVPNRTVITAIDRDSMKGQVFSNIDGAVFA
jgi:flagellar operon protein